MDDQGPDPYSAPPATAEPAGASQPSSPWRILQPAPSAAPTEPAAGAPGSEPPAPPPYGGPSAYPPYPYPTAPGTAPGAPSTPLTPGSATPTYPGGYQGYPSYPAYPGFPSMPLPPGTRPPSTPYPESAATPYYPIAPAPYPYAPSFPAASQSPLARPFPLWLTALIAVGSLALPAVVFLGGALGAQQDWAGSAFVAGIVAAALALGAVALLVMRVQSGRRAGSAIALGVVGIVLLASVGLGGLAGSSPIHSLQAHSLEGGGSWTAAIHEYALSGEHAPNAPDIARVYDDWGERLLSQRSFSVALDRFNTVVTTYADSGTAALDRAKRDLFDTYGRWITSNSSDVPYANAVAFIVQYAQSSACDSQCQQQAGAFAAQGYFQYGEQLLATGDYHGAVTQFEAVQSKYPTSTFAAQAHTEAAQAYLALGKQQVNGDNGATCATDAVATYQTLATRYADTPEGKQAQAALKAPVTVTGHISGPYPRNPTPTAVLSKHIDPNTFYLSSEYTTSIDAGSGSFTFHNVRQGTYNFSTFANVPGAVDYVYWYDQNHNYYFVQAGPLCTVQLDGLSAYPSSFS